MSWLGSSLKNAVEKHEELLSTTSSEQFIPDIKPSCLLLKFPTETIRLPCLNYRTYQASAHEALFLQGYKRLFLVRPRRAGKEVESWNFLIESAILRPGLYIMMYPENKRGRTVLWDGAITLPNGESLRFLDMIPPNMIKGKPHQDEMKIFLKNGAVIRVMGADDDPNKVRGTNPLGVVFAEWAFSDPLVYQTLMPAFRQNDGWVIIQSTYYGMNHAWHYMQEVKDNPEWYCRVDSALTLLDENGNRYITDEMIDEDRKAGLAEFMIQQEYFSIVSTLLSNLYFSHEIQHLYDNNKIIPDLMIHNAPVLTAWDIGFNDKNTIVFFQMDKQFNPVVIGYYEDSNRGFEYYVNEIFRFCAKYNLVHHTAYLPHDGDNGSVQTGMTNAQIIQELGLRTITVPRPKVKAVAIQSMRQMLYRTTFNKANTKRLIDCLTSYSKIHDDKNDVFKDKPLHNWASHGVDGYQTLTLAITLKLIVLRPMGGIIHTDLNG